MAESLADWPRPYFKQSDGRPFLFYVVYGAFPDLLKLSLEYRSAGIPEGFTLSRYGAHDYSDVLASFREGYVWNKLREGNPSLVERVVEAEECIILQGEIEDAGTLNYLRDSVGLVTYLLDNGGIAVYDLLILHWWEPDEWQERIFNPAEPVVNSHVVIFTSEELEPGFTWFHTRGMRKYGRPELSLHSVPSQHNDAVIDLFRRFIELQALGGVVEEGREIKMKDLPSGMTCHHRGDLDDPDFNNVHIEIEW